MKDSFDYIWELLSPKAEYANRKYPPVDYHPDDYPITFE